MPDRLQESYEKIPYLSTPRHQTHPDTLAVAARLRGLPAAPVESCSVLELGCATGGNLLPIALAFPGSRCVGIDLSPRQIEMAAAAAQATGAANADFRPLSITEIAPDFGRFDYIICHGVYSWVPDAVREKILEICRNNLSPEGVAYISYNTYPGWHGRGMVREMLQYHARNTADPLAKVALARQFLEQLAQSGLKSDPGFTHIVQEELELVRKEEDYYLAHEYFEDCNNPFYFHQFAAQLAGSGLQYLGESPLSAGAFGQLAMTLQPYLRKFPSDAVEQEQYFDFARNRTFRRSLVCHAGPALHAPDPRKIAEFHIEGLARPDSPNPSLYDAAEERFHVAEGIGMTVNNPIVKTTLKTLHEAWPSSLSFPELRQRVIDRLRDNGAPYRTGDVDEHLAPLLLQCYLGDVVALHSHPPCFTTRPSDSPRAFALARLQASGSGPVSNLRHRPIAVSPLDRLILARLDGQTSRAELRRLLADALAQGQFTLEHAGHSVTPTDADLDSAVADSLHRLAQSSLLAG